MLKDFLSEYSPTQISILRLIREEGEITRAELTEASGYKLLTVTKTVARFLEDGLIIEAGHDESTGGRKAARLSINPHYRYTLAVDVGATCGRVGVVGMDGSVIESEYYRTQATKIPSRHLPPEKLREVLAALIKKYGREKILGVGIGISGIVRNSQGKVVFCPNIDGWNGIDVEEEFAKPLGVDVVVDTAARCMALAEHRLGAGKGVENQVCVSIGCSIGAGIILGGKIYRGASETAGEIGHINVRQESTTRCTCGNTGCLELFVNSNVVRRMAANKLKSFTGFSPLRDMMGNSERPTSEQLREALLQGDRVALDVMSECADTISTSLIYLANIMNPELIILGGGVIESYPELAEEVERSVTRHCFVATQQNLSIRAYKLGVNSAMVGSALMVIDRAL